jgi:hypothetical protein
LIRSEGSVLKKSAVNRLARRLLFGFELLLVLLEKSLDFLGMFEQALPLFFVKRDGKPSQPIN